MNRTEAGDVTVGPYTLVVDRTVADRTALWQVRMNTVIGKQLLSSTTAIRRSVISKGIWLLVPSKVCT